MNFCKKTSFNKKISVVIASLAFSFPFSHTQATENNISPLNFENPGALLFKLRAHYIITDAKHTKMPNVVNQNAPKPSKLAGNGIGLEGAISFFVTDNLAIEMSTGLDFFKTKNTSLSQVINAYGTAGQKIPSKHEIYSIPATMTAQYHIAPYGAIRPYVGAGYGIMYLMSKSNALSLRLGHGFALQAGVDIVSKDDQFFNIDIRKSFISSKINYSNTYLARTNFPTTIKGRIKFDPLMLSIGYGFKL